MAYKYCTATNWGKNFFTHEERKQFHLSGHPGEVWVVGDNLYGDQWISKVSGAIKTKEEAQAIVTAEIEAAQTAWDALSAEEQERNPRPVVYNLPQSIPMTDLKGIKGFKVQVLSTDTVVSGISSATWASGGNIPQALYENAGAGATHTAALNFGGQGNSPGPAHPHSADTQNYNNISSEEKNYVLANRPALEMSLVVLAGPI